MEQDDKITYRNKPADKERIKEARSRAQAGMNRRSSSKGIYDKYGYHIVIGVFLISCGVVSYSVLNEKKLDIKTTNIIDSEAI